MSGGARDNYGDSGYARMTTRGSYARMAASALTVVVVGLMSTGTSVMGQSATQAKAAPATAAKPAAQSSPTQAQPWKKIAIPPLHAFKPQQPGGP